MFAKLENTNAQKIKKRSNRVL